MNDVNGSRIRMAELFFFLNMGGVERCIVNLLNYLSSDEFDKRVIVSHYGGMMENQLSPDTAFSLLPQKNRMSHLIQHLKTMDLVHLNTTNMNPFFTWSAAMADVSVIVDTIHSSVENPYASYVDFTVCISEHVASLQARPERTRVIHNGVMPNRSVSEAKKGGNDPVVILEIRRPDKEVRATLVDLVPMLSDKRRNIECWIMGVDGESSSGLKFLGEVPDPSPYLAKADFLFHFPSHEALGNVLIEAMAHGVIPITSHVGGIPEIVEDGTSGICKDLSDHGEIVKLLEDVVSEYLSNPERFESVRMEGLRIVEEKFNMEEIHESYRHLFVSLAQGQNRTRRKSLAELLEPGGPEQHLDFLELIKTYCFHPGAGLSKITDYDINRLTSKQQAFLLGIVGREFYMEKRYEEAREYLEDAINRWNDDFYLNQYLGDVQVQSRRVNKAKKAFEIAYTLDRTNLLASFGYLQCLMEIGDLVTAKQICSRLLGALPEHTHNRQLIERIYCQLPPLSRSVSNQQIPIAQQ